MYEQGSLIQSHGSLFIRASPERALCCTLAKEKRCRCLQYGVLATCLLFTCTVSGITSEIYVPKALAVLKVPLT